MYGAADHKHKYTIIEVFWGYTNFFISGLACPKSKEPQNYASKTGILFTLILHYGNTACFCFSNKTAQTN